MTISICLVAAPLVARSGVYNSARELVAEGRARGYNWSALLGVSELAGGEPSFDEEGVQEFRAEPEGPLGLLKIRKQLREYDAFNKSTLVVSLIPQTDMALALGSDDWVAYLRGNPWPGQGESRWLKTSIWKHCERYALHRAREVWATTPLLAAAVGGNVDRIVPPGIALPREQSDKHEGGETLVWAARYAADKNPYHFIEVLKEAAVPGVMYGSGPLEASLRAAVPSSVKVAGWVKSDSIWSGARAYVGTSLREAFGRSAVEASMLGIPSLLSDQFGCASSLYTDDSLKDRLVLPLRDRRRWVDAIEALTFDSQFHCKASAHVKQNAAKLTIESAVDNLMIAVRELK